MFLHCYSTSSQHHPWRVPVFCFLHDFDNFQVFRIPRTLLRTGVVIQCKMGGMVRMGKFLHSCGLMLSGPRQCSGRELDEQPTWRSVEHKRISGRIIPTEHNIFKSILHWGNYTDSCTGLGIHSAESAFLESISKLVSRPTLVKHYEWKFSKTNTNDLK